MGARDTNPESGRLRNGALRCFAAGSIIVALTAVGLGAVTTDPSAAATRGTHTTSGTSAAGTAAPRAKRNIQAEDTDPTLGWGVLYGHQLLRRSGLLLPVPR